MAGGLSQVTGEQLVTKLASQHLSVAIVLGWVWTKMQGAYYRACFNHPQWGLDGEKCRRRRLP